MGLIYLGKQYVGEVSGTEIYVGHGLTRSLVGTIENQAVYSGFGLGRELVGTFEGDAIYSGFGLGRELVGTFENGTVYSGHGMFRKNIGSADSIAGAAALLLLSLHTYKENSSSSTGAYAELASAGGLSSMSEGGCLGAFLLIMLFLIFLVGSILAWPALFSKTIISDPTSIIMIPTMIFSVIFGVFCATKLLKQHHYKPLLIISSLIAWVPSALIAGFADHLIYNHAYRKSYSFSNLLMTLIVSAMFCSLPCLIISRIYRKNK